jgi:hypothetical protein
MPSAADLIFVALLGVLVFTPLSVKLLGDAGIGWHIRTGQQILATHAIPRVDSFSATMQGKPWFAWEWLYDVVVGWLDAKAGLNGVVWITGVVIAAVFAWLFRLLVVQGTNIFAAVVLMLLAMSASTIHFLARPHVVSWLLALAWFWILDSVERRAGVRRLWILPLLMLLWVNVHGGFLIGFMLLGIFWVGAIWEWRTTRADRLEDVLLRIDAARRARTLVYVGLVSVAASLVNPYGWKLYEHIYSYLTNRFLMNHIEEFQSPNFHGIAQKCFAVMILLAIVALARKTPTLRRKEHDVRVGQPPVSLILTVLFAVYAGLYAARNIPVSSVLLAMVVGPGVGGFAEGLSERMTSVEVRLRGHIWPIIAVVFTFWIAMNGGRVGSDQIMNAHFDAKRMPVAAVDYIEKSGVQGPILSPDYWGGYLIYRFSLHPDAEARVVVDDRHDLYGEEFLKSYLKMMHVERGWEEFLRNHRASCLLLPRDGALANVLIEVPGWKAVYQDEVAVVLENGSTANQ